MPDEVVDCSLNRLLTDDEKSNYLEQQELLYFLRNKIDSDIGYNYWKNYIVSAFWSNVATPLNLTITFLTAITTAQSQNTELLPHTIYSNIAIINLIITTLITFFRPHEQYNVYADYVKQWTVLGVDLEKEFSSKASASDTKAIKLYHLKKLETKIQTYKAIQEKCVELRKSEKNIIINSATDLIFAIVYYLCMCRAYYGPKKWLDSDKKVHEDALEQLREKREKDESGSEGSDPTFFSKKNTIVSDVPRTNDMIIKIK